MSALFSAPVDEIPYDLFRNSQNITSKTLPATPFLPLFYERFIDDVIGIWLYHSDSKEDSRGLLSKQKMNLFHNMRRWFTSNCDNTVDFTMDLTIGIRDGSKIRTTFFEKN